MLPENIQIASSLRELTQARLEKRAMGEALAFSGKTEEVKILPAKGFHLYSRLRLKMDLEAPESDARIRRFLRVVHRYAQVATSLTGSEDVALLELQGETLHLFIPADLGEESVESVFAITAVLQRTIEKEVKKLAGDAWKSLRFTLDYGDTLLVDSTHNIDDSIISLAPAANEPAKQFKKDSEVFPSGFIRTRKSILSNLKPQAVGSAVFGESGEWVSIKLDSVAAALGESAEYRQSFETFDQRIRSNLESFEESSFSNITVNRSFDGYSPGTLTSPLALRGWTLRADLDGFSRLVSRAFSAPNTNKALKALVQSFIEVMDDAGLFDKGSPFPSIKLPWAGDCASRFIVAGPDGYGTEAATVPSQVQLRWQQQTNQGKWLVALAGGNQNEGDGHCLIAEIEIKDRRFQIAGGWGIRRSKQAEQDIGGKPTECVMHASDVAQLSEEWKGAYKAVEGHPSYSRARLADLNRAQEEAKQKLNQKPEISRRKSVTSPMPYFSNAQRPQ